MKTYHALIVHERAHRFETNGIAERALRIIKEGTSAVLLQSGLDEKWRANSKECYCLSAKCSRPPGRRENTLWKAIRRTIWRPSQSRLVQWLIIRFSSRDQPRLHQFGEQVLLGIFLGYVLYAMRIWKGDTLATDTEKLEKMDASEIHAGRLNAKEVLTLQNCEHFYVTDRRWKSKKNLEEIRFWKHPPWSGKVLSEEKNKEISWNSQTGLHHKTHRWVTVNREMISGEFQETTFVVIPLIWESNFTCREEESFPVPLRCNWRDQSCKNDLGRNAKKPHRRPSKRRRRPRPTRCADRSPHDSQYRMKNLQTNVHGLEAGWQTSRNIQARSPVTREMEKHVRCSPTKRTTKVDCRKTEARQCKKVERDLLHWSSRCGVQRNY